MTPVDRQACQELDRPLLEFSGHPRPHLGGCDVQGSGTVETSMEPPPAGTRPHLLPALIIRGVTAMGAHGGGRWGGATRPLAAALHEAHDLAQPIECE